MVYQKEVLKIDSQSQNFKNPTLIEQVHQLNAKLQDLFHYLKDFPEDQLNGKPGPDTWSAMQVCYHLIRSEALSLAYVKKKLSFEPKLKKATMATKMREKLLTTYLATPVKFNAPENVSGEALPDYATLKQVMDDWQTERDALAAFIKILPEEMLDKEIYKHPFAGRLSILGMIAFFDGHFDRHLKQIKRTLRRVD